MRLTYDVLFIILETQSLQDRIHDLSSMSRACRTLRIQAIKHLLDHDVTLRDARDTLSFALFMLGDEDRRFPLLRRSLSIRTGKLSGRAALALFELVSRIWSLERLVLTNADQILASDARLPRALASLTCLKHLDFHATQDSNNSDCVYFFKRMQSRLLTASLHLPSPIRRFMNGRLNCELVDPIRLLRNSADTLTELHGCNFEARRSHDLVYPHVKRLNVHLGLIPLIAPYMVSFPNVTSVEVTCGAAFEPSTVPSFSFMNEDGQMNIKPWSALEELVGNLTDIYVLALRCTVTTLRVKASGRHRILSYLAEVLSHARPTHLLLEVESPSFCLESDDSLMSVFRHGDAPQSIRTFVVRIVLQGEDCKADLDDLFVRVIETIKPLPLTSFKVQILHESLDLEPDDRDGLQDLESALAPSPIARVAQEGNFCLLEAKLRGWDATHHVDYVRQACPLLKQLTVEGLGCSVVPWPLLSVRF
ncbi:hypothetical protein BD310DRAFT_932050 [Dichomitus squalens]|uniref:F-box domain-containing protein n=1 Tax=Dichomitus squalens TaxID=114155 RepID=A0A4Q9PPC6_9APHY|nr:hypothetical protein BD310DRAFT_932050 [Dichomitus squalens]